MSIGRIVIVGTELNEDNISFMELERVRSLYLVQHLHVLIGREFVSEHLHHQHLDRGLFCLQIMSETCL